MSEEALRCWLYVSHVTKRPLRKVITEALLEAYDTAGVSDIIEAEDKEAWLEAHPRATEKDYRKLQKRRNAEMFARPSFEKRVRRSTPSGVDWVRKMGISL